MITLSRRALLLVPIVGSLGLAAFANAQGPTWASPSAAPASRWFSSMAFDSARGRTVLFGGNAPGAPPFTDTWEWDGVAWIQQLPTTVPPRQAAGMVYDARRGVVVMTQNPANLSPETWEWDGSNWRMVTSAVSLPAFLLNPYLMGWFGGGANPEVILHGQPWAGQTQTWGFDGVDWHVRGTGGPGGGSASSMAYVPTVGRTFHGGGAYSFDGSSWSAVSQTGVLPPANISFQLTYDAGRAQLVRLGAQVGTSPGFGSDFTYFGTVSNATSISWSAVSNLTASQLMVPDLRVFASHVYDSVRQRIVYFGGVTQPASTASNSLFELPRTGSWTQREPLTTAPTPRVYFDMAHDPVLNQTVLFGGYNGNVLGDTWTYNGTNWIAAGTSPLLSPRRGAPMTHVPSRGMTLLFGGENAPTFFNDAAWWNGNSWIGASSGLITPSARSFHDMVYDAARDRVVLFGGTGPNGSLGDTWEFRPTNVLMPWTLVFPTTPPPARHAHRMAYDARLARVVMFGGADTNGQFLGDTWAYTGSNGQWAQLTPASSPPRRWNHAMEYDPKRNVVVLTGGYGNPLCGNYCASLLADAWEFDSVNWRPRTAGLTPAIPNPITSTVPGGREGAGLVYDGNQQRFVLFGGSDPGISPFRNDTWNYSAIVDRYAFGQTNGIQLRCTMAPAAGRDIAFEFPSPASFGWLAVHFDTAPYPTHSAPAPPACGSTAFLFGLNPQVAFAGGNPGRLQFTMPNWALGMGFAFQAIALDAVNSCVRISDPLTVTIQAP